MQQRMDHCEQCYTLCVSMTEVYDLGGRAGFAVSHIEVFYLQRGLTYGAASWDWGYAHCSKAEADAAAEYEPVV